METVWITGASSGIGEACAYRWAEEGARLVLTATNAEKLASVAAKCREKGAPDVAVLPYDLSHPDDIPALARDAWETFGDLSTIFLNAGISQPPEHRCLPPHYRTDRIRHGCLLYS